MEIMQPKLRLEALEKYGIGTTPTELADFIKQMDLTVRIYNKPNAERNYAPSYAVTYKWVKGLSIPPISILAALAKYCKTNVSYLIGLTEVDKPDDAYELNCRLKEIRCSKRISREALADLTGITYQTINTQELHPDNDGNKIRISNLLKLLAVFDISLDFFYGLTSRERWEIEDEAVKTIRTFSPGTPVHIVGNNIDKVGVISDDMEHIFLSDGSSLSTKDTLLNNYVITGFTEIR